VKDQKKERKKERKNKECCITAQRVIVKTMDKVYYVIMLDGRDACYMKRVVIFGSPS
jgi:hypothetical protein